ncbi:hypothetical protein MFLAVUS_003123 [Mucor flavus]|uniref:Galactose oxidase n=1 Tax=Mucor flavus TaxID=439312 RepID=A0ABP9YS91_9FUNG
MSDRPKAAFPTAPIAWMSEAYETMSPKPIDSKQLYTPPASVLNTSTVTSLESYDRPESPTLPPEQDLPSTKSTTPPIIQSVPTSPTRHNYAGTSIPPPVHPSAYYYQTMDKINRDPPLPPAPMKQPNKHTPPTINTTTNTLSASNSTHHHHHHNRKIAKKSTHMSDHMAAAIELSISPSVPPAPAAGMYWSRAVTYGKGPSRPLRAHSANLIGEYLYVFGGCDIKMCFNTLYMLDMDTLTWSKPRTSGQSPPPCRAHSCTTVEREIGGGDGPNYFNDLYVLNLDTLIWTKPKIEGDPPSPRRAHTTCIWNQKIIIVGGGDGARALADVHTLDVSDPQSLKWYSVRAQGNPPIARGYHTSNLVKDKLIVYGGSDGHECFSDVHVLDLVSNRWSQIDLDRAVPRLAHSATQVGSYVFIIGGHDGTRYSNDVLLLNLVTMSWETRKIYGGAPSARGYHTTVLHDSRLYILGGYDGRTVFEDVYMLELSACAYLPQITNFEIDV